MADNIDITINETVENIDIVVNPNLIEVNITKISGASVDGLVPYTGATDDINLGSFDLTANNINVDVVNFDLNPIVPTSVGSLYWDNVNKTLSLIDGVGATALQIGQEERVLIKNTTGATLTDGKIVYITGATGNLPSVSLASALNETTSAATLGMVTETIANGSSGFVTITGLVNGLNTLAFNEGDIVWLSNTAGEYTNIKPTSPSHLVLIGYVTKKSANGSIYVKIQNTQELNECSDVLFGTLSNNDLLVYESSTGLWKNKQLSTLLGGTGSQFVKGNGSLDSTIYATQSTLNTEITNRTNADASTLASANNYTDAGLATKQNALSGLGFVKINGTTISYDNETYYPNSNPNNYLTSTNAASTYIPLTQKGAINGVATLGSDGKVPNSQIPALAISETFPVASQTAMLALSSAEQGDVAVRTDISKSFILTQSPASTLSNWQELLTPTDAVQSVNGQTGVVNLTKSDVGLGNVDNTSDLNKPISTATQTALGLKENVANKQNSLAIDGTGTKYPTVDAVNNELALKQNILTNPVTGVGSQTAPTTYALQDGTILYHSVKWFTPTGTVSTSGTTVTSAGTQFTSAMVGAKLTINGEWRIITAFTNTTTVVVESDYSENYSGVVAENWGVYSKERENVGGFINQYTSFGFNYITSELYTALGINNLNTILKSQVGTSGNARLLTIKNSGNIEKAYFRADGTIMGQSIGTTDNALIAMSQDSNRKGLNLANNAFVMWSNSNAYYNTKDLGLRRNSAGVLEIYDGITATGLEANRRDLLVRNTFASKILIGTSTNDGVNDIQANGTVSSGNTTLGTSQPTANNQLTRKDYVDASLALKANDVSVVHIAGNETITGSKVFTGASTRFDIPLLLKKSGLSEYNQVSSYSGKLEFTENSGTQFNFSMGSDYFDFGIVSLGKVAKITNTLLSANRTYDLPNASGTIALTSDIPSSSSYIQNQDTSAQPANMWISGSVKNNSGIYFSPSNTSRALVRAEVVSGDFRIFQYDSGGAYLRNALSISNSTGAATFASTVTSSSGTLIGGTLTGSYIPKATGPNSLGNSLIYDNGTNVLIGKTTDNGYKLNVNGNLSLGLNASAPTGVEGAIYYNSTTKKHYGFDGTTWNALY